MYLYPCQNYYQKVKDRCFSYSTSNGVEDFEGLTTSEKLEIVSKVYQRNVILFSTEGKEPITVGKFSGTKMDIFLRADEDGFFECIKSIEYMKTAAFCQSLVYEKLYESFGVSKREQHQAIANVRTKVYNIHQKNYGSYDNKNHSTLQEVNLLIYVTFLFIEQKIKQGDKVFVKQASSESMDEQCIGHVQKISDDSSTADVYVEKISGVLSLDTSLITKVPTPKHHSTKGRRDKLSPEETTLTDLFTGPNQLLYLDFQQHRYLHTWLQILLTYQ
ncbi:hypothetical protein EB796_016017 [Bugula neritina]|uniref:Uncharacterized protein n=1 Tax=Bugula neritina TaxID=10212 RepID=A0A7J7JJU4_BUGNE|nr:hypothetical protein EB796_016017 [Bugula neritina]